MSLKLAAFVSDPCPLLAAGFAAAFLAQQHFFAGAAAFFAQAFLAGAAAFLQQHFFAAGLAATFLAGAFFAATFLVAMSFDPFFIRSRVAATGIISHLRAITVR